MQARTVKNNFPLTDVFTPTKPARETFVERQGINNRVVNALQTPGMQLIIYGHSGSGKTTLLINKLDQLYEKKIFTRCMGSMTIEQVILDGFSQLDKYYEETKSKKISGKLSIGAELKVIKLGLEVGGEESSSQKRILPPMLTPQLLAKFFGELNCCWVLEDFHKIAPENKERASQIMKVFVDTAFDFENTKVVAIGAVNSGKDVVAFDSEMATRVSEILVPLMDEEELMEIISLGEKKLNVFFHTNVKNSIVKISSGLASVCHQLCLNCCRQIGVFQTTFEKGIIDDLVFEKALLTYVEDKSGQLKSTYDKATKHSGAGVSLPKELVKILAHKKTEEVTLDQVVNRVNHKFPNRFSYDEIKKVMYEMTSDERCGLLAYDETSENFLFVNLLLKAYVQCIDKEKTVSGKINNRQKLAALQQALFEQFIRIGSIDDEDFDSIMGSPDLDDFDD